MTIHKYIITPSFKEVIVKMPAGAQILSCGIDKDKKLCLWALIDTDNINNLEQRKFYCVGTGWKIPSLDKYRFIGTAADENYYIWHIIEIL